MERGFKLKFNNIRVANINVSLPIDEDLVKENQLEINYYLSFDTRNNLIYCLVHVVYFIEHKNDGEPKRFPLLHIDVMFEFLVDKLETYLTQIEEGKWRLEKFLHQTLVFMAFNTIRGIIFEKTRGTKLNEYYFPIIPPSDIDENRIFDFNPAITALQQLSCFFSQI